MTWVYDHLDDHGNGERSSDTPQEDPHCELTSSWQRMFHPVCNDFHSKYVVDTLVNQQGSLLPGKGAWRRAWKMQDVAANTTVAWKTLKLKHITHTFKSMIDIYKGNAIDAMAMEKLTASNRVVNVYALCGSSIVTQFAGVRLTDVIKGMHPQQKLPLAIEIVKAVADVHAAGSDSNSSSPSLAHYDLHPENIVFTDTESRQPLLNDFNSAILLSKHTKTGDTCSSLSTKRSMRRPPEEFLNSTSTKLVSPALVDIYGLGNLFYLFVTGKEPWELPLRVTGKGSYRDQKLAAFREIARLKASGSYPPLRPTVKKSTFPPVQMLLKAMNACYRPNPRDRPTAQEVVEILQTKYPTPNATIG